MAFLRHPMFDASGGDDWIELLLTPEGRPTEIATADEATAIVLRDFEQITTAALGRIQSSIPGDWLKECPFAYLNELLFHPTEKGGIKVYLEYIFLPSRTENSPHSDSWWAIASCPYPSGNPYTGRIEYAIVHFGWATDWMD